MGKRPVNIKDVHRKAESLQSQLEEHVKKIKTNLLLSGAGCVLAVVSIIIQFLPNKFPVH